MFLVPPIGFVKKQGAAGPVAATLVGSNFDSNSSGDSTVAVSVPTHSENDLLVFVWFGDGGGSANIASTPSGWTNDWNASGALESGNSYFYVSHRVAGASEPGSYQWNLSGGSEEGYGVMFSMTSVNTSTPIDQITGQLLNGGGVSSSHTAPNITTTADLTRPISIWFFNRQGGSTKSNSTPPTGMSEIQDLASGIGGIGRGDLGLYICYDNTAVTPAGAYSGKTVSSETDVRSYAITMGIRASGT